jgi:hypothetical protein
VRTHACEGAQTQERAATAEHRTTDSQTANHHRHWERRRSVQGGELNRGPTRNQQTTNTPPAVTRETTPGPMPTTKRTNINIPPATSFRALRTLPASSWSTFTRASSRGSAAHAVKVYRGPLRCHGLLGLLPPRAAHVSGWGACYHCRLCGHGGAGRHCLRSLLRRCRV